MGAPAILDAQAAQVLDRVNACTQYAKNHVYGGAVSDGGTTQSTGASTVPNLDLDVALANGVVGGTPQVSVAAATDVDSDGGDQVVWGATSAVEVWCALVALADNTYKMCLGAVATTTAGAVKPTNAQITAIAGTANWAMVADVKFTRTADTAITVGTPSYARRSDFATFANDLSETEDEFRAVG